MYSEKANAVLLLAATTFCCGCATDGLKMPFRESIAARWNRSDSTSENELSPEFREAQKVFKKDPEGTLLAWARWQEDVGEYGEARKKYRELLIAYPDNIEARLGLARIELSCGRVQQAEEILTTLAEDRPKNMPVRLELGRLYTQQEDWPRAIAAFEDASAIDPENQVGRYELGIAFAKSHQFDQALSHLTYSVGKSAAHYNIGYVLHEQGRDADAVEWFRNALEAHPDPKTAERTNAMLAQISPKNSRDRNSKSIYPDSQLTAQSVAARSGQATVDQYRPASFDQPALESASANQGKASRSLTADIANGPHSVASHSGAGTAPAPVRLQPAQFAAAGLSSQNSASDETTNPFRMVSHSATQGTASAPTTPDNRLPSWHSVRQAAPASSAQQPGNSPAK